MAKPRKLRALMQVAYPKDSKAVADQRADKPIQVKVKQPGAAITDMPDEMVRLYVAQGMVAVEYEPLAPSLNTPRR